MAGAAAFGRLCMLVTRPPVCFRMPDCCFRAPFGETGAAAPKDWRVREARGRVDRRWLWTTDRSAAFPAWACGAGSVKLAGGMSSILTFIVPCFVAIVAWIAVNFVGAPVLALRKTRQEALGVAGRYWSVSPSASDEARSNAVKALHDAATALVEQGRADPIVRRYCEWLGYDLEMAACSLRGLAEGPRGQYSISDEERRITRDAVFVLLGATRHLSSADIAAANEGIATVRRVQAGAGSAPGGAVDAGG